MRIKLDENLPTGLVQLLTSLGPDVDTVSDEGMAGQDDTVVWRAAQDAADSSLPRISTSQTPGRSHLAPTTVSSWFGFHKPGRAALSDRVATLFRGEDVDSWAGCLVTATLRKVRVKRATPA